MEKGSIVQITDEKHHWYPALIIVDEVKSWGIVGYGLFPPDNQSGAGTAYIRLANGNFSESLGKAEIVAGWGQ